MKQEHKSKIMEAIHEEAQVLYEVGAIDKKRMMEYDNACLVLKPQNASTKKINSRAPATENISNAIYAHSASPEYSNEN
jgi:DNA-binding transcriptional regulator YiaG